MIETKGLEAIEAKLKKLQEIGTNTKPLMQTLGNILQNEIEDAFENETSPFGQKWAALKPGTLKQKTKQGKGSKILRSEGYLADRWVTKADNDRASVSNNIKKNGFAYGLTHQFGTNNAFGRGIKIPARPFLPVSKKGTLPSKTKKAIRGTIIEFIKNII